MSIDMPRDQPRENPLEGFPTGPLVSTDWLATHLADRDVRVVDCRWYLAPFDMRDGAEEYQRSRIAGAVYLQWDDDIADPERPDLWMLAGPERFAAAMQERGIGENSFVVAYDDQHVTTAARLWWALRVYGHSAVAVLDGGITKWAAEGRPLESGQPSRSPRSPSYSGTRFRPRCDDSLYATKQDVLDVLASRNSERDNGDAAVQLVDGRMAAARAQDGGCIADSIALPGIEFVRDDGTWASASEITARISAAGAEPAAATLSYCRGGVGACGTALAYAIAGNDSVAVYDGSWTEWIADPDTPRQMDRERMDPERMDPERMDPERMDPENIGLEKMRPETNLS